MPFNQFSDRINIKCPPHTLFYHSHLKSDCRKVCLSLASLTNIVFCFVSEEKHSSYIRCKTERKRVFNSQRISIIDLTWLPARIIWQFEWLSFKRIAYCVAVCSNSLRQRTNEKDIDVIAGSASLRTQHSSKRSGKKKSRSKLTKAAVQLLKSSHIYLSRSSTV